MTGLAINRRNQDKLGAGAKKGTILKQFGQSQVSGVFLLPLVYCILYFRLRLGFYFVFVFRACSWAWERGSGTWGGHQVENNSKNTPSPNLEY
jgi:hypothetical protein